MHALPALMSALVTVAAVSTARAEDLPTYYFPERTLCTALVDFQKNRRELQKLSRAERNQLIARELVREFVTNGKKKCENVSLVRVQAIYIPGTDNYGRPDFPNRINLLRLEGAPEDFTAAGNNKDLPAAIKVTTFE